MNTVIKSRWTAKDESNLADLIQRKERIMRENRVPVEEVVHMMGVDQPDLVVRELINHADAVRDALEPFDSGARPS